MRTQEGPKQVYVCSGCTSSHTHYGSNDAHHRCGKDAWKGVIKTSHGENMSTPMNCPFLIK
jgi:hypothetical protein